MSSEVKTATQKKNMFSGVGASLIMSAAMTGGFGSISSVKRNGFKGAIDAAKKIMKQLGQFLKIVLTQQTFLQEVLQLHKIMNKFLMREKLMKS